jgi:hypothetical protein
MAQVARPTGQLHRRRPEENASWNRRVRTDRVPHVSFGVEGWAVATASPADNSSGKEDRWGREIGRGGFRSPPGRPNRATREPFEASIALTNRGLIAGVNPCLPWHVTLMLLPDPGHFEDDGGNRMFLEKLDARALSIHARGCLGRTLLD